LARSITRFANPAHWQAAVRRMVETRDHRRMSELLDTEWANHGPLEQQPGGDTIIADAMWYNANHFLRLRMFLGARMKEGPCALLGVLRSRDDTRARRALERLGFEDFIYLDDDPQFKSEGFQAAAAALLKDVQTHADFLTLTLPENLPAYIVYDTVLKQARDPQPPISDPVWRNCLAEALCDIAIYQRELDTRRVTDVALSHPWKTEWGSLIWLSIKRDITAYHLTGFMEAMRVRRFRRPADFATPVEHLPLEAFEALPETTRQELSSFGAGELERRAKGTSSDINASYAYQPEHRIEGKERARESLVGDDSRPIAVIFSHIWYDFPHTFAMTHFTDFRDWIESTLARVRELDDVIWLLKPHPTEEWYGGFRLAELVHDLPDHVRLLPTKVDNKTVLNAADCVLTVHGSVGLEATAWGIPVILADRSYFSDWDIGYAADSRSDYLRLVGEAGRLTPPTAIQKERARAAFALALGEPPDDLGAYPMGCDSRGVAVIEDVIDALRHKPDMVTVEIARLQQFMAQGDTDSYAVFHLLEWARQRADQQGDTAVTKSQRRTAR
jgi:hypothetical protein